VTPVAFKCRTFFPDEKLFWIKSFFQKKNTFSDKQSYRKGLLGPGKQIDLFGLEIYRRISVLRMIVGWWPEEHFL
jgi:hypothetical protein